MVLQGCKPSSQKSRLRESGRRRHGVWIAIEYSYKLGQKMNLNSWLVFAETVTYYHLYGIVQSIVGYVINIQTTLDIYHHYLL